MENEAGVTEKAESGRKGIAPHHVVQYIIQESLCGPTRTFPENWYQERRQAEKRLFEISGGRLALLSRIYSGDGERHQVVHELCGHPFRASMNEVREIGPDRICPHCNITDDLRRFLGMEQIQHYVIEASRSAVYFYAANPLGSPDDQYRFLCMLHRRAFHASFAEFQQMRGETDACPLCREHREFSKHFA